MAVLPKYQLKQLFEKGDLITQDTMSDLIEATYNPTLIAGSNIVIQTVKTPSGDQVTISSTGGGGSALTVTDGTTSVANVNQITIAGDASVTNLGGGVAKVTVTGGGGGTPVIAGDGITVTAVGSDSEISINLDTTQTNLVINGSGELTFDGVHIKDEGTAVGTYKTINFIGDDVLAQDSGTPGQVNVYVPTPTFASHFNTTDGAAPYNNGLVSENIINPSGGYWSRSTVRISSPTTEGNPFKTNGWAGTNQDAYPVQGTSKGAINFMTAQAVTGFSANASGDATITVNVYDADGTTVLHTYTTPTLYTNGVYNPTSDTRVVVTISGYTTDTSKYKAYVTVQTQVETIFNDDGLDGGRYHVEIIMNTDTATDGGGTYTYTQSDIFLDTNASTPSINGSMTIAESSTPANILTKHLSGVEYYIGGSQFLLDVTDIDNFNQNTQGRASSASWNFRAVGTEYGLPTLQLNAWSPSVGTMVGWTNAYNVQNVDYDYNNWAITASNWRFRAASANGTATVYDPWNTGNTSTSSNQAVLIDTYATTGNSNTLRERFDDEQYRLTRGSSSYSTWNSTATLGSGISNQTGSGTFDDACVVGSNIVKGGVQFFPDYGNSPSYGSGIGNLTTYKPDKNGTNPNYTSYTNTATYHRLFETTTNPTKPITSFELAFTGDFIGVGGNAFNALLNNHIRIYIRKKNATAGSNYGHGAVPHSLHGAAYNFANYTDPPTGVDAGDGSAQCRTGSTPSNTVTGTFGGSNALEGFYVEVQIVNSHALLRIDQIVCTLNFSDGTSQSG